MKLSEFLEEAAIMKEMKHPNLVQVSIFLVLLRNRLISGGFEPVLSHTEKLCTASY